MYDCLCAANHTWRGMFCLCPSAHAGVWAYQRGWPALIEQQRLQQHIVACLRCIVQHAVAQTAGQHRVQNQLRGDLVAVREPATHYMMGLRSSSSSDELSMAAGCAIRCERAVNTASMNVGVHTSLYECTWFP